MTKEEMIAEHDRLVAEDGDAEQIALLEVALLGIE